MEFLNTLFNYTILYIGFVVIAASGIFIGKTLRMKKND